MSFEAYRSIDVDVFKEILENDFFKNEDFENYDVLSLVKKISTTEIKIPGLDLDIKKEVAKIKYKQFGFRTKADFYYTVKSNVFDNITSITLIPKKVYHLEDEIKTLPDPDCEKGKKLKLLLGDSFERLKVKTKYILHNCISDEQIIHYARKNIQVVKRYCYDAKLVLIKIQKTKNRNAILMVIMINAFMINVLSYLRKMFSSYFREENVEKYKEKANLYDVIDFSILMEPKADYTKKYEVEEKLDVCNEPIVKLNVQTNQFLTAVYETINMPTDDEKKAIEVEQKKLEELLSKIVCDKNGNLLKIGTIQTCLKHSREDKRVSGSKKIDVLKYYSPKNS